MARRRERAEEPDDESYDDEGYRPAPPASPWADPKIVVVMVVIVGVLGIVGALVFRSKKAEENRRARLAAHRKLGAELAREVHKIGIDYFSSGKRPIDPTRWEAFRKNEAVIDAILVELDDFKESFIAAANYVNPKLGRRPRSTKELGGGVKLMTGKLISGGIEREVWIFELLIQDSKGVRLGKAIVCLTALGD